MVNWKWDADFVTVDGVKYAISKSIKEREVEDFLDTLNRKASIFVILKNARAAYLEGRASYENANENLETLLGELDKAASEAMRTASGIEAFFDPVDLSTRFGEEVEAMLRFALEAAMYLKSNKPNKVKDGRQGSSDKATA